MPSSIALIAGGVTYHLAASTRTPYTGSSSPWTSQSTTPFWIEANSNAPLWTPQAAQAQPIWRGSPPFRLGRALADRGYDNVTQSFRVKCLGNSHDTAVALAQILRRAVNRPYDQPVLLMVQPENASQPVYFEVLVADCQEDPGFINAERRSNQVRLLLTLTTGPFGGMLSAGETALSSGTMNNTGTGSPNNVRALASSLSGDRQNDGQPMNVKLTVTSTGTGAGTHITHAYLATIQSRTYSTTGAGTYTPGDSVSVWPFFNLTFTVSDLLTYRNLQPRYLLRLSSMPSTMQIRIRVWLGDGTLTAGSASELYTSPWIGPESAADLSGSGPWAVLLDFGTWPVDMVRPGPGGGTPKVTIFVEGRGTTQSCTVSYSELLLYYTFAKIESLFDTVGNYGAWAAADKYLLAESFMESSGMACLPVYPAGARALNRTTNTALDTLFVRGELPRYIPGASLYVAWHGQSGHATNAAATVSATQAPLWATLRGND